MKPTQEQIQAGIDGFYNGNRTGELSAVSAIVEDILNAALSASPAGVKPWRLDKALAGYETVMDGSHEAILRFSSEYEFLFFIDAMAKGRIMSAIEPAGVWVETAPTAHVGGYCIDCETETTIIVDTSHTCNRCQGNGEIVTDWDRYEHPQSGDKGDEAVAECPDCDGEGKRSTHVTDAMVLAGCIAAYGDDFPKWPDNAIHDGKMMVSKVLRAAFKGDEQ